MGSRRVLVVDDERGHRVTTSLILRQAGYAVAVASSGEEAIESVRAGAFDAVILDARMPGIGGVAALEAIRALRPLPVFLVTAYALEEVLERARRAGATAVLRKPLDFDALLDELARSIGDDVRGEP